MSNSESTVNPRALKEIWQEYLKVVQLQKKEEKLGEFLLLLAKFNKYGVSSSFTESELASIGNLLGCELLKVISNQCEVLEHDSALVHYFQKGLGLCLLQALHILADRVNNCNSEVSNVLVSVLPCLLSVSCELQDDMAFALLQKLSISYKDLTCGKKNFQNLYEMLLPSPVPAASKHITILQLFGLILDIVSKLCTRGCSLAIAESSFNVADKLTTLLLEFNRSNKLRDAGDLDDEFPECTWTETVQLVCICMVLFPLWSVGIARRETAVFSHRIDQSELVNKLLEATKNLKNNSCGDTGFQSGHFKEQDILGYRLSLVYSLLGLVLTLLKDSACCEAHSDLSRKHHTKELVDTFVKSGGSELITSVSCSLNNLLSDHWKVNMDCNSLLRDKACFVIATTGQLISAMKKALFASSSKSEDQKLQFSLTKDAVRDAGRRHRQDSYTSRFVSTSSQPYTVTSSSDSDNEPRCQVNISEQQYHSNKDCVISRLCSTMLMVYNTSTVEEIDVVTLNSLSHCGACSCMDVSAIAMALLSRFVERSPHVQNLTLAFLCNVLLKDTGSVKNRNFSKISPDANDIDNVFHSDSCETASPTTTEHWSFLRQLFLLATEHNGEVTITILKHLKALTKFGTPCLREAVFDKVLLPFLLKYKDTKRVNALSQVCGKLALLHSPGGTQNDSCYTTPTETCDVSKSGESNSPVADTKSTVSDDALRISLTSLLTLLESDHLQRLFLESDGVQSIVNFLGHESLHSISLGILQLLAGQEDVGPISRTHEGESLTKRSREAVVVTILWRSMMLLDPTKKGPLKSKTSEEPLGEFAAKVRLSLRSPKVLRLLCQLWRTCLELLKTNSIFRELFVQSDGPSCVVIVLQVVRIYLQEVSSTCDDIKDHVIGCVTFMEHVVAVGWEFEHELVDDVQLGIQITEQVKLIQRLVHQDKLLKEIAGIAFCTRLLNLAVGAVAEDTSSSTADIHDSEKLLFGLENSDDSGSNSDCFISKSSMLGLGSPRVKDVEPGYEADVEVDTCTVPGDVSRKGFGLRLAKVRRVNEVLARRRTEVAHGLILYPQMCEQLVHFLACDEELTALVF